MSATIYGREMRDTLHAAGIPAQIVTRKRATGHYEAEFFIPELQQPVESASVYASMIERGLTNVRIVGQHDNHAHWRPGQPVIMATVVFSGHDITPKDQTRQAPNQSANDLRGDDVTTTAALQTAPAGAGQPPLPPIGIMTNAASPGPLRWWNRFGERVMQPAF
jgi:hypothetical protein